MNVQAIVKRMFHTKPSKIVGVDIGTGSIKMVQIETGSKPVVSCFAVAEPPLELINNGFVRNSDAMISFIKGLVAKYDFNARHAVFTVGGRNAFVREIDMPEMPDEEMKQSVAWDSSQYVPYEADTYYVDSAKFGAYTNEGLQPVLWLLHLRMLLIHCWKSVMRWPGILLVLISKFCLLIEPCPGSWKTSFCLI